MQVVSLVSEIYFTCQLVTYVAEKKIVHKVSDKVEFYFLTVLELDHLVSVRHGQARDQTRLDNV